MRSGEKGNVLGEGREVHVSRGNEKKFASRLWNLLSLVDDLGFDARPVPRAPIKGENMALSRETIHLWMIVYIQDVQQGGSREEQSIVER